MEWQTIIFRLFQEIIISLNKLNKDISIINIKFMGINNEKHLKLRKLVYNSNDALYYAYIY